MDHSRGPASEAALTNSSTAAAAPAAAPSLRRELGLRDITLFAIGGIIGTRWIVAAAHAGPGSVTLWLAAALLFVIPLTSAVGALCRKYPGTGGLYLWARNDFGPWHGFLCFFVYWVGMTAWLPSAAMFYMSAGLYSLGPSYAHLAESRACVLAVSLVAVWIALGTNLVGLRVGKWTQNIGGASCWLLGLALVVFAAVAWTRRGPATPVNLVPAWNWGTVSLWGAMAYGMAGLELLGFMGGEIRDPDRTIPKAGRIVSVFTVAFYSLTTLALLVLVPQAGISELYGLAQGGEAAAKATGLGWAAPLMAVLILGSAMGQFGGVGTAVSRLPLAAGTDGLLPAAFSRIHPRWSTPYVSILVFGALSSLILLAIQAGDTMRAAYQTLVSLMVISGFLPYIYLFGSAWKAGRRVAAASGYAVTFTVIVLSVIPTDEVSKVWLFEAKLFIGTAVMIAGAWLIYRRHAARSSRPETGAGHEA